MRFFFYFHSRRKNNNNNSVNCISSNFPVHCLTSADNNVACKLYYVQQTTATQLIVVIVMHSCMSFLMAVCSFKCPYNVRIRKIFNLSLSFSLTCSYAGTFGPILICISPFMQWNACHFMHVCISTKKKQHIHRTIFPFVSQWRISVWNCEKMPFKELQQSIL